MSMKRRNVILKSPDVRKKVIICTGTNKKEIFSFRKALKDILNSL